VTPGSPAASASCSSQRSLAAASGGSWGTPISAGSRASGWSASQFPTTDSSLWSELSRLPDQEVICAGLRAYFGGAGGRGGLLRQIVDSDTHRSPLDELFALRWRAASSELLALCIDLRIFGAITDELWDGRMRRRFHAFGRKLGLALRDDELAALTSTRLRSAQLDLPRVVFRPCQPFAPTPPRPSHADSPRRRPPAPLLRARPPRKFKRTALASINAGLFPFTRRGISGVRVSVAAAIRNDLMQPTIRQVIEKHRGLIGAKDTRCVNRGRVAREAGADQGAARRRGGERGRGGCCGGGQRGWPRHAVGGCYPPPRQLREGGPGTSGWGSSAPPPGCGLVEATYLRAVWRCVRALARMLGVWYVD
jgi:hypothetical protein